MPGNHEQEVGGAIAGKPRHQSENNRQNYRGDERLQNYPGDPECGLLVEQPDVAFDQDPQQIAIVPKFAEVQSRPAAAGPDPDRRFFLS